MAASEGLDTARWNGMLPGGIPFMQSFFSAGGAPPDPAALAAAYAQLQQHSQLMGEARGFGNGRSAFPPDRSGVKKCGHCQVQLVARQMLRRFVCRSTCGACSPGGCSST